MAALETAPPLHLSPAEVDALVGVIYDDVSVTGDRFLAGEEGYPKAVAQQTLARARVLQGLLKRLGVKDEGLDGEVDALAKSDNGEGYSWADSDFAAFTDPRNDSLEGE